MMQREEGEAATTQAACQQMKLLITPTVSLLAEYYHSVINLTIGAIFYISIEKTMPEVFC